MHSSTWRSSIRGRPVRPCTAGFGGGSSCSASAHSSSVISLDGVETPTWRKPEPCIRPTPEPIDLLLQRLLNGPFRAKVAGRELERPGVGGGGQPAGGGYEQ